MATATQPRPQAPPDVPNLARDHGFEPLEIEGELPADLAGTLYRCGPGLMQRFGVTLPHPFEADGMIVGVRFDGRGGALGAARILTTPGYHEEQAAGRYLYSPAAPWLRRVINGLRGKVKNTGNTRAWTWGQRVFALMEAAPPLEIDPQTLEVLGERDLDDAGVRCFSAHPHRVAGQAMSYNFGLHYGRQTTLDLYALPDPGHGSARRLTSVATSWPAMVHDFVVTPRYAVFLVCPAALALAKALLQIGDFSEWFRWAPELGTELIVVPLAEPDAVRRFQVDAFWVWHFVNAFERGDELVIDYCRYPDLGSLAAIGGKSKSAPPKLHRATLDPRSGRWTSDRRWDVTCEFPRVAPVRDGREHHSCWVQTGGREEQHGIAHVEIETGAAQRWEPEDLRPGEPIPAPKRDGADEDDCWILTLCHDYARERACVAVLDGRAIERGPVAKLYFDQPLPQTFHGDWSA